MTPIELRLRNFMSYRDEATLDFTRLKVACFAGDNGAGKSALLDALTWAVWGRTRASSDRDVIALGADDMEVTFIFALFDREYRIFRRRTAGPSSRQSLEFDVREAGTHDWQPITGDNVRQTERKIVETLNLDYETFVNSAFILQGRADSFSQIGPTDRKRILAEILNLGEYDELNQLARDEERTIRVLLGQLEDRLARLDSQLAERPLRLAELEKVSGELTEISERLDRTDELLRGISAQLAGWEQLRAALARAADRAARGQRNLAAADEAIANGTTERERRVTLVSQAGAIEQGVADLRHWRSEAARLTEVLLLVRHEEQERDAANREIEREESDLRRAIERLSMRREQLAEQLSACTREAGSLGELRAESEAIGRKVHCLPELRETQRLKREEQAGLQAANAELKRRMKEIKESLDQVVSGVADCPVCRAPLSEPDRTRIAAEWQADGEALGKQYRTNLARVDELNALVSRLDAEEADLQELDRKHASLTARIVQAEAAEGNRAAVEAELETNVRELKPLNVTVESAAFARNARERNEIAIQKLARLDYAPANHDLAISQERELTHWEEQKQLLDRARIELDAFDQQLSTQREQRVERLDEFEQATAEACALEAQLAGQPDLRRQADELRDERDRLDIEKSELQALFGRTQGALAELDRFATEREQVATRAQTLALDAGALRELIQAFGSNGIQAMIVEGVLPEVEHEANEILRRMSSGALRVSFRSQREALSVDKMIETLDIVIRDEHGERPYALYSGGEAFRINFAVRIALSKLLAKRAGSKIDILVIDEGFGSQDARGRDGLIEALRSIEQDFGTIVVITHLHEIRELFPTRVEVTKTEQGSELVVVDS